MTGDNTTSGDIADLLTQLADNVEQQRRAGWKQHTLSTVVVHITDNDTCLRAEVAYIADGNEIHEHPINFLGGNGGGGIAARDIKSLRRAIGGHGVANSRPKPGSGEGLAVVGIATRTGSCAGGGLHITVDTQDSVDSPISTRVVLDMPAEPGTRVAHLTSGEPAADRSKV